jgi:plasmid stability protein
MKNITVAIDDETYRRARIWAAERGTSISAMVRCILTTLPSRAPARRPLPRDSAPQSPISEKIPSPPDSAGETVVIPAWGATVLDAVRRHLGSEEEPNSACKNAVVSRESVSALGAPTQ